MTNPNRLIPSTLSNVGAGARPRALRASSLVLCAIGLLSAVACGDNTGDDVIQPSSSGVRDDDESTPRARDTTNTRVDEDGPAIATGVTGDDDNADESGLDDEDEITGRSGGTRSTGGGGGGRRRTSSNDDDDDVELESDAGVVDAGDAGVVIEEDGGVVVEEDAGVVVEEDAGVVADAG